MKSKHTSKLKNIGQIPGTIIYTGDTVTSQSKVRMIQYNSEVKEMEIKDFQQCV